MSVTQTSNNYDPTRAIQMNSLAIAAYDSGAALNDRVGELGWQMVQVADNDGAFGFAAEQTVAGKKTLVLSFRGTDSISDVLEYDLISGKPFRDITDKVASLINYAASNAGQYDEIVVTGHSLGGAMAQWALSDLTQQLGADAGKVTGYTIGSPGLGAASIFGNVADYQDRMFQFQNDSGWLGDAVTVYPGQIGTEINWGFSDSMMDYYGGMLGYVPGFLRGNPITPLLEQHASYVYGENGIRALMQDPVAGNVNLGLNQGPSNGNDLVTSSSQAGPVTGGTGNDVISINSDCTVTDASGSNAYVYTAPGYDAVIHGNGMSTLFFPIGVAMVDVGYAMIGSNLVFDLNLSAGGADDGSISLMDWSLSSNQQVAQACFTQTSSQGFLEQVFVDLTQLANSVGLLNELGSLDNHGYVLDAGGNGADLLTGANSNDRLYGYGGNDALTGSNGQDWLDGGSGNDILAGGAGIDYMTGGSGADRFIISDKGDVDIINDFSKSEGDRIELGGLLDSSKVNDGNLDKYVWAYADGNDTVIAIDQNGKAGWWDLAHATGLSFSKVARLEGVTLSNSDLKDIISVTATSNAAHQLVNAMAAGVTSGIESVAKTALDQDAFFPVTVGA